MPHHFVTVILRLFCTYRSIPNTTASKITAKIKGCILQAPAKSSRNTRKPALVSPHPGHGNPVSKTIGQRPRRNFFRNAKQATTNIIAHLADFIS